MDTIEIRQAGIDDAQALLDFLGALKREGLDTLFHRSTVPTLAEEEAWVRSFLDQPGSYLFVATRGAAVIGLMDVRRRAHPQLAHTVALGVSVLREHRGHGIGQRLFSALFEALETAGEITRVELEVFSNNPRAIALYERLGFAHEGRRQGAVRVVDAWVDIVQMTWRRPGGADR